MPYTPKYTEHFHNLILGLEHDPQAEVIAALKVVLSLEDPREQGGKYLRGWAYPFSSRFTSSRSAIVCELNDEERQIIFHDIISNL